MSDVVDGIRKLLTSRPAMVVGVGNPLRGDDGVGSLVARRLQERGIASVIDAETVPENYLGALLESPAEVVLFVDAVEHGAKPGSCWLGRARALADRTASTHAPSLMLLAGMLEAKGREAWLVGVQPQGTQVAAPMSAVAREAATLLEGVLAEALATQEDADV